MLRTCISLQEGLSKLFFHGIHNFYQLGKRNSWSDNTYGRSGLLGRYVAVVDAATEHPRSFSYIY